MTVETEPNIPHRTLGLTGITIHAMALTAPGAFLWLLYQVQASAGGQGVADIWPGVLLTLLGTLLTALSFGELARRYPEAGFRSAYHFAERFFARQQHPRHKSMARLARFVTGWAAHLYYWIYPGVLIAFLGGLVDYLLRYLGYHPTVFGEAFLAASLVAFIGFLALRGITGTTTSSIVLNVIQLVTLLIFSLLAIAMRLTNPGAFAASDWSYPTALSVLTPHNLGNVLFQAALALILMVGFESSTAFGASASNPQRDIPRAVVLALVIQGVFAYLLGYFASGFALNAGIDPIGSRAPIGDMSLQIGDLMLGGYGATLMFSMGLTVLLALLGGTLTAINNGVRISFAMALDEEMPDVLGLLHPRFATPYYAVVLLCVVSAVVGAAGIIGGLPVLMGIILASNLGALLLYAMLCILTVVTFFRDPAFNFFRHLFLPVVGLLDNVGVVVAAIAIGLNAAGVMSQATSIALSLAAFWLVVSVVYYFIKHRR